MEKLLGQARFKLIETGTRTPRAPHHGQCIGSGLRQPCP
jgi:hypothetical protein